MASASADVQKLAIYDSRIIQTRPRFAVQKGALSLTTVPFNAISQSQSQHTYNVNVPSQNVFVDRSVDWESTVALQFDVSPITVGPPVLGDKIVVPGRDIALAPFPLHSLVSTLTATINDTTVTLNVQDVLYEILRLVDLKENRLQRTCPTKLDTYAQYSDAFNTINNPIGGYADATSRDELPNGAFPDFVFTDRSGNPLPASGVGSYLDPFYGGAIQGIGGVNTVNFNNGVPVITPSVGPGPAFAGAYRLYVKFRSVEKLVLSPFIFNDKQEQSTGLFGINNIQLVMNMGTAGRTIRSCPSAGRNISNVTFNATQPQTPFSNSRVDFQFLTPSLDIPLPPKSVVPYMEYPRYISNSYSPIAAGVSTTLQSTTIVLPQIPDLLLIYCKPFSVQPVTVPPTLTQQAFSTLPQYGDFYLPITTASAQSPSSVNPLSVNFDNFAGLLSSTTSEELYSMSIENGLLMDYANWKGRAIVNSPAGLPSSVPTAGGFLVLKPSRDITLQTGQSPSLIGNYVLQFALNVTNPLPPTATPGENSIVPQLYVVTVNSGFFESQMGSSRILKGVLSEQDIISAPMAPAGTRAAMERLVGGGLFSSIGNALSRGLGFLAENPEIAKAGLDLASKGLRKISGGAMTGGEMYAGEGVTGGAAAVTGGRKRAMLSRLM